MPVSNSATLHHTSILVNDLELTAEKLAKQLSVTWNIWTITPEHCFVNGEPSPFSFKAAFAQVGEGNLELIAPHTGHSVYNEHLKVKGEGYHHTCFAYANLESMRSAKEELLKQGYKMVQNGYTEGFFEFCYMELTEPNILLELLYLKELPPPEKTIG
ncbi:MAG TPA: VOC family protein [Chitinophagaceae bacterium]|nr:VOC family protein [Chitinophagaceae bacterium]MCB9056607.1 VOC family protein [Chitinophagales bacterium]HPG11949.1 VOC family protein [Chitinophagaceae bacterium]HRX93756.1 VOC family protein [Chitinophagaceae bacterium]